MNIKFCHTSFPPEHSMHAKDTAFEKNFEISSNTHMRNKSVVFCLECSFSAYKYVYLGTNKKYKLLALDINVHNLQIRMESFKSSGGACDGMDVAVM